MQVHFGGDLARKTSPIVINLFGIGFALLVWALAAYIIDLIVQSAG